VNTVHQLVPSGWRATRSLACSQPARVAIQTAAVPTMIAPVAYGPLSARIPGISSARRRPSDGAGIRRPRRAGCSVLSSLGARFCIRRPQ